MASGKNTVPSASKQQDSTAPASTAAQDQANAIDPAMLEEDDEFEDFPVDGTPLTVSCFSPIATA